MAEEKNVLQALQHKYDVNNERGLLQQERDLLAQSFARVEEHREALDAKYAVLAELYADMQPTFDCAPEHTAECRALRYHLYELYFAALTELPLSLRRALRSDKDMAVLEKLLRRGGHRDGMRAYWLAFLRRGLVPFAVGIGGELWFLDVWGTPAPLWQLVASLVLFVGGLSLYFVRVFDVERLRHKAELESWLHFRAQPGAFDRPTGLLQTLKLGIPLLVALGSALLKLSLQ